jgi:hypothetical protein
MRALRFAPLLLALAPGAALADENQDLNLIPESVTQPAPAAASQPAPTRDTRQRIYLEDAFTLASRRGVLVPPPPPPTPDWQDRLFLDARKEWTLATGLSATYSGRLNLQADDVEPFPTHHDVRHDFREGYLSWQTLPETYLDLGRINLKSGVAAGFNPTDFFKTRSVVEPQSIDPAVLREDRLGTFMLEGQHVADGASLTLAFAPKLYDPSRVYTATTLPSFDPMLDRTNAHDRILAKASVDLAEGLSPEFLVYHEGERTRFGTNITESVGQSTVLYAEWAGGRRASLIADAFHYGVDTGSLPPAAAATLPFDAHSHFQNDLTAGLSYTTANKIVLNFEYQFHQAGFSEQDWRNWFTTGQARTNIPGVSQSLWYVRAYAAEQQEPINTHSLFLRADWQDAFIPDLELTALTRVDLHDGSNVAQLSADYYLSDHWTVGALAEANLGGRRTDQGSVPQAASAIVKLMRYF